MEPSELLDCRDVSLGYEGQTVLTHLDLIIRAGDYLCIAGDNGSRKSTLLRRLLGPPPCTRWCSPAASTKRACTFSTPPPKSPPPL